MVTPTPGRAAASQTLKTMKIETWGGEEGKNQKKTKRRSTVCAGTCESPFRFAQVAHQTSSRRTTPTTSTVVVSSSSQRSVISYSASSRFCKEILSSWPDLCLCCICNLFGSKTEKRQELSCTDRQTDWLIGRQDETETRQIDAFGRKAHYTGRSQGKYSLFCCFGFWGWGRKTVVNGTSFCAVTRDDRCVESLCCISCFCSFGFWGWGRKTAVNGSFVLFLVVIDVENRSIYVVEASSCSFLLTAALDRSSLLFFPPFIFFSFILCEHMKA